MRGPTAGSSFGGSPFRVSQLDDRIVRIDWSDDVEIGDDDAAAAIDALHSFTDGRPLPLLVDVRTMRSISRNARKQFSQSAVASRVALLVGSALSRTVANFFLGLSSTQVPMRLFDDEVAATSWLTDDGS